MPRDLQLLSECIAACASARDGRGRWRHERATAEALYRINEPVGCSVMQAGAARRLGEWLSTQSLPDLAAAR